jgi:hypothetical protein
MSIPFTCECGKKMAAKDEFAGKRVRCPECQRLVAIPHLRPAAVTKISKTKISQSPPVDFENPLETHIPSHTISLPPKPTAPVVAPPMARPLAEPVATPVAKPIARAIAVAKKPRHPWFDTSLTQTSIPWRPGDEARYQSRIKPAREWAFPLVPALSLLAVVGFFVIALTGP